MLFKMKNKSYVLIGLGLTNIIHASLHFLQFLQSILWMSQGHNEKIDGLLHSPVFSILWMFVGLISLWIGIKDFKHHKKCEKN